MMGCALGIISEECCCGVKSLSVIFSHDYLVPLFFHLALDHTDWMYMSVLCKFFKMSVIRSEGDLKQLLYPWMAQRSVTASAKEQTTIYKSLVRFTWGRYTENASAVHQVFYGQIIISRVVWAFAI